jgi:hypothetical protein
MMEKVVADSISEGTLVCSSVSEIRIMWNITSVGYLNKDHPWSSV